MASAETLKHIVKCGIDLQIENGLHPDTLVELIEIANRSGSHLTITTKLHPETIVKLCEIGKGTISFIDVARAS